MTAGPHAVALHAVALTYTPPSDLADALVFVLGEIRRAPELLQ